MKRRLGRVRDVHAVSGSILIGPSRRTRFRMWLRGRRDGRVGLPTPAVPLPQAKPAPGTAHDTDPVSWSADPQAWSTPAIREITALAARSHHALGVEALAALDGIDTGIARLEALVARLTSELPMNTEKERLHLTPKQPRTCDDETARANRRAATGRSKRDATRQRLDTAREQLAELRKQREVTADRAVAQAMAVSSFCLQYIEVYRAANLRVRGEQAPVLAAAWPQPEINEPAWLADLRPRRTRAAATVAPIQ
ncbi:hypothetical protein [Frankia sp. CIT1]|uniref:hypothetical protein n=1 Tax=Frankia sp. CIT1 TaxID=2880974 RepID=UPI001EF65DA8|nr:hypothetical protein [Frankia sp. CIT1]